MSRKRIIFISRASMIAALYVLLTVLSNLFGLASGEIQLRISEALCILPVFTASAVPGLFIGCILSNIIVGGTIIDVIFGSAATLFAALLTFLLKKRPFISLIPPILLNTVAVPLIIYFTVGTSHGLAFSALLIFISEFISCGILGALLYKAIKNSKIKFE